MTSRSTPCFLRVPSFAVKPVTHHLSNVDEITDAVFYREDGIHACVEYPSLYRSTILDKVGFIAALLEQWDGMAPQISFSLCVISLKVIMIVIVEDSS